LQPELILALGGECTANASQRLGRRLPLLSARPIITIPLTQTGRRLEALKCGYGEKWKRSAGLIKLLMRKFSGE